MRVHGMTSDLLTIIRLNFTDSVTGGGKKEARSVRRPNNCEKWSTGMERRQIVCIANHFQLEVVWR